MNQTTYERGLEKGLERGLEKGLERGLEKGLEKGIREGRLKLIVAQLEASFGPITAGMREQLRQRSTEDLWLLGLQVVKANSLAELGLVDRDLAP